MKQVIVILLIVLLITLTLGLGYMAYHDTRGLAMIARVRINEIMASNDSVVADEDGEYHDWIELYNDGSKPVDLSGWYLSDSRDILKWQFPKGTLIEGKGYLLVFASGKDKRNLGSQLHTNFKLSTLGEDVVLADRNGKLVDRLYPVELRSDISYGRISDGAEELACFSLSTPGTGNAAGVVYEAAPGLPMFSHASGFYEKEFMLVLSTAEKDAEIRYTLDGTEPDEDSPLYTGPIRIKDREGEPNLYRDIQTSLPLWPVSNAPSFKGTVVRARVFKAGSNPGETATRTYFVAPDADERYSLPVISLVTDPANLFDKEKGIYVPGAVYESWKLRNPSSIPGMNTPANYHQKGDDWERPVYVELFEPGGTVVFTQNAGLRIHGGRTSAYPQKSLRLYASAKYDPNSTFAYEIFEGLTAKGTGAPITEFKRLVLRNSGNDWVNTLLRDSLMQALTANTGIATQGGIPAVVFINGEFWGIHIIQQRQDRFYLESHYNADPNKVVILEDDGVLSEGLPGDEQAYFDMIDFINSHDLYDANNFAYLESLIDIDNYLDYFVANVYCNNTDWPQNNVRFWRYKGEVGSDASSYLDGRWRWMLFDTDLGFGLDRDVSFNALEWATARFNPKSGEEWPSVIIRGLLENEGFKAELINRFLDHLNSTFRADVVLAEIDKQADLVGTAIDEHLARWNLLGRSKNRWLENVEKLRDFARERPAYLKQHLADMFGLEGMASITAKNGNPKGGYVRINSVEVNKNTPGVLDESSWTGEYFSGVPVTISAHPYPGYRFAGWTLLSGGPAEGCLDLASDTLTLTLDGDLSIAAAFVPASPVRAIVSGAVIAFMILAALMILYAFLRQEPFFRRSVSRRYRR